VSPHPVSYSVSPEEAELKVRQDVAWSVIPSPLMELFREMSEERYPE